MTIQKVCEQAAGGRGLWTGIFPKVDISATHPLRPFLPTNPHITLAHLGRGSELRRTVSAYNALGAAVIDVLTRTEAEFFQMEITGIGLFWRRYQPTVVALINSAQLCELRESFLGHLERAGVNFDDRYGFIPHLTLTDVGEPFEFLAKGNMNATAIKINSHIKAKLVAGDGEVWT